MPVRNARRTTLFRKRSGAHRHPYGWEWRNRWLLRLRSPGCCLPPAGGPKSRPYGSRM
jgi:hypothetical protein